jgi:hypothetical protein
MNWLWRIGIAACVGLFAASFVAHLAYPDCGYEGAPPCESNWVYEWKDYTLLLGFLATAILAFVVAIRALTRRTPLRVRRWAVLGFAIPWAYAAGWLADVFLNDDPCLVAPQEGDRLEEAGPQTQVLDERWPVRTNCRIPLQGGGYRFEQGDASAFYAVFGFWIVLAALVVAPGRLWAKATVGLAAFVLSVFVMFV